MYRRACRRARVPNPRTEKLLQKIRKDQKYFPKKNSSDLLIFCSSVYSNTVTMTLTAASAETARTATLVRPLSRYAAAGRDMK